MMIFLIDYDRKAGKIVTFQRFTDAQRTRAEEARLDLDLQLNRIGTEREVVLLEAATEAALRRTHRRYFESIEQLELLSTTLLAFSGSFTQSPKYLINDLVLTVCHKCLGKLDGLPLGANN